LKKRFKYLGGITVFHFLADIGYNVLKPDRVLCRIIYRLGLVDSEEDLLGVIAAGRKFSSATGLPIRYIDIIFVAYGQVDAKPEFGLKEGICLSNSPKCELCGIYKFCQYKKKKKLT
jgi:DNA-3-methyladenine glycosylase I